MDLNNHEVVLFRRLLGCSWSCCQRCCPAELTVEAPIGNIGRIKQLPACRKLRLRVECPVGNHAATIICPNVCKCIATKDVPYKILDELGKLFLFSCPKTSGEWQGYNLVTDGWAGRTAPAPLRPSMHHTSLLTCAFSYFPTRPWLWTRSRLTGRAELTNRAIGALVFLGKFLNPDHAFHLH